MQEWFDTDKSVNVIHQVNKMKEENHTIISVDGEKHLKKFNIHS